MGGYLKIIDAPAHSGAQAVARRISPEAITKNVLREKLVKTMLGRPSGRGLGGS